MTVQIPRFFNPDIFGKELFDNDFNIIDSLMLEDSEFNLNIKKYMQGIHSQISNSSPNIKEITNLKNFLENIDKRRSTDYTKLFPWLVEEFKKQGL
jgi:hypothetical protein